MFRSKLTVLDSGIVMSQPSPRVRVIFDNAHHSEQKAILYVGFSDKAIADACYAWLLEHDYCRYDRTTDTGVNKPRRAKRVEGSEWEIKIHRPDPKLIEAFVKRDLAYAA